MFCPKCGFKNLDGTLFCQSCGTKLSAPQQDSDPYFKKAQDLSPVQEQQPLNEQQQPFNEQFQQNGYQQDVQQGYQNGYTQPMYNIDPVLASVKQVASSPLFLTAVIAFSTYLLFAIINVIRAGNLFTNLIRVLDFLSRNVPELGAQLGEVYGALYSVAGMARAPIIIFGLLALVPTMLVCTGLWITYSSAANKYSNTMSTSGLTIIKVITILQLIGVCVACAIVEVFLIIFTIALATDPYTPGAVIILAVAAILIIGFVYALVIAYNVKIVKSLNAARDAIITRMPSQRASVYVAVWIFISAFFTLFSIISNPIGVLAQITAMVCFGILIFNFNTSMLRCTGNIAHQTYQHQVQQPFI